MFAALLLLAQAGASPAPKPFTVETLWQVRRVGTPAVSPDGKRLAFTSKREGDSAAQLYVISLEGGGAERVYGEVLGWLARWLK